MCLPSNCWSLNPANSLQKNWLGVNKGRANVHLKNRQPTLQRRHGLWAGRKERQGDLKCMLLGRAYKLHLPLSPSPIMTWRQLGVCQPKKQLHLKTISFLIAERLLSCCLAAGSHLVPGTWEWMLQAGSQPCPMPHRVELACCSP